jgi:hypothetical protein
VRVVLHALFTLASLVLNVFMLYGLNLYVRSPLALSTCAPDLY